MLTTSNDTSETRQCKTCGETQPLNEQYFRRNPTGSFRPNCLNCEREAANKYYHDHREIVLEQKRQARIADPEKFAERDRAQYYGNPEKQKARHKKYRDEHHEERLIAIQNWRDEHPDEIKAYSKTYYQEHQAEVKLKARIFYRANKEYYYGLARTSTFKRRNTLTHLPYAFTETDWQFALNYWHGCCAVCGRQLKDLFATHTAARDHWIPVTDKRPDNPGTVPWNILPLCHGVDGCNNSKRNHDPHDWLLTRYPARQTAAIEQSVAAYFALVSAEAAR